MGKKRFDEVDVSRALGIIGVIAIHILTYNLTNPLNKFLWNYLQFFVIAFVFCSGFVLTLAYQEKLNTIRQVFQWYKKRLIRIALPFWIYLVVHYSFWLLFPDFFSGLGLSKSVDYFIKSALFTGGTNFNFLPLLFIQLMILFPLFLNLFNKKKIIFTYLFFSIFITLIFTVAKFPYSLYRETMWVPWSLVLLLAIYFYKKEKEDKNSMVTKLRYLKWGAVFFLGFGILYYLNPYLAKTQILYNHKYPPDLYYLLFGVSLTLVILLIAKLKIWQNQKIKNIYYFVSRNSYKIFFIHFIILDFVLVLANENYLFQNPLTQFVIIFLPSLILGYIFEKISLKFRVL
ncbi:MAG: hypothetical protein A3B38_03200 [Candidatus Levybacteria bacterium RIFCSPLOWO2_01_FULL_36_13]|nr:MAG: hypothetical protein A2684_01575 [Candidatus Levybacteria bacterium RIFCSPHIGHO2_01_FULL_36_15b]OGH34523.1 MAG: hypothetical protein A3B38_03200 [Candidatus Levybacteria bacterium RIFCSPLOWO2_01_FULL_36_13]